MPGPSDEPRGRPDTTRDPGTPDETGAAPRDGTVERHARTVHGLRIEIDPDLCVGFGDCMAEAPEAFDLDESAVAFFTAPETVARWKLLDACAACPVDAITVYDENGERIIP
ncbi:MAG: ferredoxin [Gemmatimonadota bacterium]